MKLTHKSIIKLLTFFAIFFCSIAQAQDLPIIDKVQIFAKKLEEKEKLIQGGVIAILYQGKVVHKKAFGYQKGDEYPVTEHTIFPLASLSKPISALAIALESEQDKLNLNEKFKLPYLQSSVSLTNILSHTTGYAFRGDNEISKGLSRKEILNLVKASKQACKPGKCFTYSNILFSLLGDILALKKLSLNELVSDFSAKIGTKEIMVLSSSPAHDFAYPHSVRENKEGVEVIKTLPFPPFYPKTAPSSAGIFASIDGMVEFFKLAFGYRPDLISQKTLDNIYSPKATAVDVFYWGLKFPYDQKNLISKYALGWRIFTVKNQPAKKLIFHSGCINGINTFIGFIPSTELGIIILVNQKSRFPLQTGIDFWKTFN